MSADARIAVLMYHATPAAHARADDHDPHYAVPLAGFVRHLELIAAQGLSPVHVRDAGPGCCAITFDDGHASNADAAEALAARGATADFFVNTSTVGGPGFVDWPTLRAMADAGMSVQSHGHTHRYFDELPARQIRDELHRSKHTIEQAIGRPVTLFAPPGGRLRHEVATIARELGFDGICSSRPGAWRAADGLAEVPRLAVLASTPHAQLVRWARCDPAELRRLRLRKGALDFGKRLLGNRNYERLRAVLVGGGR